MSAAGWEIDSPDHIDRYIDQVLNAALESVESQEETISQLERVIVIEADVASSDLECGGGPAATAKYEALELEYQALVVAGNLSEVKRHLGHALAAWGRDSKWSAVSKDQRNMCKRSSVLLPCRARR